MSRDPFSLATDFCSYIIHPELLQSKGHLCNHHCGKRGGRFLMESSFSPQSFAKVCTDLYGTPTVWSVDYRFGKKQGN